jgi:RNA polymerase sigma factor for flagellar operon FliA
MKLGMMTACQAQRPIDPPIVLARVRAGLALVDIICHQIKRQYGVTMRMDDLVSHGREGLLAAARSFDPERGVPFRRWASFRVRGAVIDGVRAASTLPRSAYSRLRAAESAGGASDAEKPASHENAAAEEKTPEAADRRLGASLAGAATALALGFIGADGNEWGEPTDRSPTAEEWLLRAELQGAIRRSISELPDVERTLVERHYFDGVTFEQAATELGLSKSWASRLHARAIGYVTRSLKRSRWV